MIEDRKFYDELDEPYQLQAFYSYLYLNGYTSDITQDIFDELDAFINADHIIVDEDGQVFRIEWSDRDAIWDYDDYDELTIVEEIIGAPMDVYGDRAVFEWDASRIYDLYSQIDLDLDPSEADRACSYSGSLWRHLFDKAFDASLDRLMPVFLEDVKDRLCFSEKGMMYDEDPSRDEIIDLLQAMLDNADDDFFYWHWSDLCRFARMLDYEGDPDNFAETCEAGVPVQDILA